MLNQDKHKLETIKKSLQSIGYTLEEAENQIEEVGKLITMAILHKLLKKHGVDGKLTPEGLKEFLKERYNAMYLRVVIEEESNNIIQEYLKEITIVLSPDKKENFYRQVKE